MTSKDFKGYKRTVKSGLNGGLCPHVFEHLLQTNPIVMAAYKAVVNKNREHKDLSYKWYRKYEGCSWR